MAVTVIPMGYLYEISGTTSEVRTSIIENRITKVEGYFVDNTGKRYILGRR